MNWKKMRAGRSLEKIEPLEDKDYFQRFFLDGGAVAWPNGADIAPETLYAQAQSNAAA